MQTDLASQLIRTLVPLIVGGIITYLGKQGLQLDDETSLQITLALQGVVTAAYYALVAALETKYPALGWFLGRPKRPTYDVDPATNQPR